MSKLDESKNIIIKKISDVINEVEMQFDVDSYVVQDIGCAYIAQKSKQVAQEIISLLPHWKYADESLQDNNAIYFRKTGLFWSNVVPFGEYYLTKDDFKKILYE